jgi:hypothetical protein
MRTGRHCVMAVFWIAACHAPSPVAPSATTQPPTAQANTQATNEATATYDEPVSAAPLWVKACFHAHSQPEDGFSDDGLDTPAELATRLAAAGFDVAYHTPHANPASPQAAADWLAARTSDAALTTPTLLVATGEELTVPPGPNFHGSYSLLGQRLPGNLDHLALIGIEQHVPYLSTIRRAARLLMPPAGFALSITRGRAPRNGSPTIGKRPPTAVRSTRSRSTTAWPTRRWASPTKPATSMPPRTPEHSVA